MDPKKATILIAYFSRSGNNYVNGQIVNLIKGNTEVIADMIRDITKADLFYILSAAAYPSDYMETTEIAKRELHDNARPKLTDSLSTAAPYDIIFLGYPNWWGTMPMPVCTFLESCDFSGKTIVPFCTHEGSGLGRSVSDIKKICPESIVLDGIAIRGGEVTNAQDTVIKFVRKIGIVL
ncbi:flavodoxin [uncultured Methanospirillum sp.]|uniref:flavodoxin n=1 Tax=uncultured Methanospirillum sp. TaxID=262503 RepID=UPI0029C6E3A3|nr:flavodoxin [uncultured Methanospirillum sp.]